MRGIRESILKLLRTMQHLVFCVLLSYCTLDRLLFEYKMRPLGLGVTTPPLPKCTAHRNVRQLPTHLLLKTF